MIDMAVFKQFQQAIAQLGEMAQPEPLADGERVARAKAVMHRKIDRSLALDLEACVNCGYCSEACHFFQSTQDPKYTPTRKLDLLCRVHARESAAFAGTKAWQIKREQIDATGADTVVLSCASCRLNFMEGAEVAQSTMHIESLVELVAAQLPGPAPA